MKKELWKESKVSEQANEASEWGVKGVAVTINELANEQADEQADKQADEQADEQANEQVDEQVVRGICPEYMMFRIIVRSLKPCLHGWGRS